MHRAIYGSTLAAALLAVAAGATAGCAPASAPVGKPMGKPAKSCICEQGQRQSPIDLAGASPAELPVLEFGYRETVDAEVRDTGKSVQVDFGDEDRPSIAIRGERFQLLELHFHRPSEHRVGDREDAMELHFVHRNDAGELAVVGVFLEREADRPHPVIELIWSKVPERVGEPAPIRISPAGLLPADRTYYRYAGSLTTGDCAEGVRWHVLRGRVKVSPEQVTAYRHPNSARDPQPLHGRPVLVGG